MLFAGSHGGTDRNAKEGRFRGGGRSHEEQEGKKERLNYTFTGIDFTRNGEMEEKDIGLRTRKIKIEALA